MGKYTPEDNTSSKARKQHACMNLDEHNIEKGGTPPDPLSHVGGSRG